MTTLPALTITARYGARLLVINILLIVGALSVQGVAFSVLANQGFLIVLAVANGGWLAHVLTTYADTGTLPVTPPVAQAQPPAPPVA